MRNALCIALVVGVGAGWISAILGMTRETPKDDVTAVLLRMESRQIADVHPRLFRHHFMWDFCDSGAFCRLVDEEAPKTDADFDRFFAKVEALQGKAFRDRLEKYTAEEKKRREELKGR